MQNSTQAQAINNAMNGQMPPLRKKKAYEANVLHVARQRTEERIITLRNGQQLKITRTYSMVR